jgi:hypothetical protein
MRLVAGHMPHWKISVFCIARTLAGCNLHLAGSGLNEICIRWQPTEWNLHLAGGRLNEICIRRAADWIKFASGWWPTECKFCKTTQLPIAKPLVFCNHAGATFFKIIIRSNKNIKTKCGQHTGKALSNHQSFSPSQSHEIVPLWFFLKAGSTIFYIQIEVKEIVHT